MDQHPNRPNRRAHPARSARPDPSERRGSPCRHGVANVTEWWGGLLSYDETYQNALSEAESDRTETDRGRSRAETESNAGTIETP